MISPAAQFDELLREPENRLDVPRAALVYAINEYPALDVGTYLARLHELGETARGRIDGETEPFPAIDALNEFLFEEEGFAGNTENYYDPRNSFLNEVLDRRLGIPITLALVYTEVGRRAGLPLHGIGFPGRFLARYDAPQGPVYLDPFDAGSILDDADLQEMLVRSAGPSALLDESHLQIAAPREILARMLRNLKGVYAAANIHASLLWVTEFLLKIHPDAPEEIRDHGMALANLQRYAEALNRLQRYAALRPDGEDAEEIRKTLRFLRRMAAQMN